MNKENKGLADNQEGDFILNESGTSVSMGLNEEESFDREIAPEERENKKTKAFKTDDPGVSNDIASDKNAKSGEGEIKAYNDLFPNHPALEDIDEIQSTDDV